MLAEVRDVPGDGDLGMFAGPLWSAGADDYRTKAARDLRECVEPLIERAEEERRFPASAIRELGRLQHFRDRWAIPGPFGDVGAAIIFAEELGKLLAGGISAGVSLHGESALCLLRATLKDSLQSQERYERAVSGTNICCIAVTEPATGSDPSMISTLAEASGNGWKLNGRKKFISMARTADVALVLARTSDRGSQLSFFAVSTGLAGFTVVRDLKKHGTHSIETCELRFDNVILTHDALLGRRGMGLPLFSRAMTCERLALCAQLVGALSSCLDIARTYLKARSRRAGSLWEFQALRHRFADRCAEHDAMEKAVVMTGYQLQLGLAGPRDVAALKLFIAPRVETAVSEIMQLLGGMGYLSDLPVERALRDVRLARIGAGTDDIMRELVAEGLSNDGGRLLSEIRSRNHDAFDGVLADEEEVNT